ncbi:MAG: acetyl-CoA carboxylase biotin carboxyl carrier protein subunit, partial [Ilumatobacteraceae bacterium]
SHLVRVPRFPLPAAHVVAGSLVAPMPGTVSGVRAAVGDEVSAGQTLVTLEAMKMEHSIRTPIDGTVIEMRVAAGEQVAAGAVLVVVDAARARAAVDAQGGRASD